MSNEEITLPPHDEVLERAVLGGILLGGGFDDVAEHLTVDDWYLTRHKLIYAAMQSLSARSEPIDYLTVGQELERQGKVQEIGGLSAVAELTAEVASAVNLVTHAKACKELSILRSLRWIGKRLVLGAEERKGTEELAQDAEKFLFSAMWGRQVKSWLLAETVIGEALDHIEAMQKRGAEVSGIPTGLVDVDRFLGGWQPSDLAIVAARPSMGKTAFMCGAALAGAESGRSVAIVSLEMSAKQLGIRLVANRAHADVFAVMNGRLRKDESWHVGNAAMQIAGLPIAIDDSGLVTVEQLRAKVRQLKIKKQVDILFVDYLQLMSGGSRSRDSRQVEVSQISRGLKLLAKELNITVVALSQLSRAPEMREDKRPILSDLRESGSIEQDADIVIALYRDEVYNDETMDKGIAEVLIRKHRNGPIGDVQVAFMAKSARFDNLTVRPS